MSQHPILKTLGLVVLSVLLSAGCGGGAASARPNALPEGRTIDLERSAYGTAQTAWEILVRAHTPLRFQGGAGGSGRLFLRGATVPPLVIVDGAVPEGWSVLHLMPASQVARIRVLSGLDASARYGPPAAGGAIVIETKRADRR